MRVVMQRAAFAPVVSMAVWVRVGSADERPPEAGLAHLHEHLVFKGTARRGVGRIAAEVEGAGGEINAFTSYDHTCYYINMGKDEWRVGLDILADALGHAAFDPTEMRKEIGVVLEELALYRDLPAVHLAERAWAVAFRQHPYGRPIVGRKEVLRALRRRDVLRFYGRHYRPERMVLSIVGDLDLARTKKEVAKLFGALTGPAATLGPRAAESAQRRFRGLVLHEPVHQAHLNLVWHGPRWSGPLVAELDLLSMVLGSGDSSRLEHRVKSTRGLVHEISAHVFAPNDPGLFAIDAVTDPPKVRAAMDAILHEVYRTRAELVGRDELERAKRNIEASFIGRHETAAGISQALGYSVALTDGIELEREYLAKVHAATREGLQEAANRYLLHRNLTAAVLLPPEAKSSPTEMERRAAKIDGQFAVAQRTAEKTQPSPTTISLVGSAGRRGRLKRLVLPNGIRLIVKETAHAPLVAIRTCMLGGVRYEPALLGGLSHIAAELLTHGVEGKSALQFAREVEDLAGSVRGIAGYNSIGVAAEFLSRDFATGLGLVTDAMQHPTFRPDELRRVKQIALGRIRQHHDEPQHVVRDLFAATLYGDHPYGRPMLGDEASVARIHRDDVQTYWRSLLHPANLVVSIVGDVSLEEVARQVEQQFPLRQAGAFAAKTFPDPPRPHGFAPRAEHRPKEQAHIMLGFLGCRIGSPDENALQLLNAALSGQGGRLFFELRDQMHLAYSVHAFQREGIERGSFGVYIGTGHQTTDLALSALREQIRRVIAEPPRGAELARAKRYLIGSAQLDLQTGGSLSLVMALNELLGVGYRAHLRFAERVRRVTDGQMAAVVRRYLDADNMAAAIVRP